MKFFLVNESIRSNCTESIRQLELKSKNPFEITIKEATRKAVQNAKMWAMLGDISKQVEWHGHSLTQDEWKDVLSASLFEETTVPAVSGRKMVLLGKATSKFTVSQMTDMIEFMYMFGTQESVRWSE